MFGVSTSVGTASSVIAGFGATEPAPTNANAVTAAARANSFTRATTRLKRTGAGTGSGTRIARRTRAGDRATVAWRSGAYARSSATDVALSSRYAVAQRGAAEVCDRVSAPSPPSADRARHAA